MRVLVACEYSGKVRDAFIAAGHEAMSVDLLPTESPGPHYRGDIFDVLDSYGPDLLVGHPPCQFLANAGVHLLVRKGERVNPERWLDLDAGANFFRRLYNANVPRIAIENPVMHKYAKARIFRGREPVVQTVQPYEFGHDASKRTCLWLRNLPPLVKRPEDFVAASHPGKNGKLVYANQTPSGQNKLGPSADRAKIRAETYDGIAAAMAAQWG